jgi:hypothetical protein
MTCYLLKTKHFTIILHSFFTIFFETYVAGRRMGIGFISVLYFK